MSTNLVRKLLQQTSELECFEAAKRADTTSGAKKRKRRDETTVCLDKKELLQRHIQSKIRLDRTIRARGKHISKESVNRDEKEWKKQSKLRSKALQFDGGVGNSRSSSYQKAHQIHEPTFNKKRHQAEKKEKMLKDIAKILKKTRKPLTK